MNSPQALKIIGALVVLVLWGAPVHADTLFLTNGESLSGKVLGASPHLNLQFQTAQGIVYVPWQNIQIIEKAGHTYDPSAFLAEDNFESSSVSVAETAPDIEGVPEAPKGLWGAEWSGRINAGASLQSGNTDKTTANLDASTEAKWTEHRLRLEAEYNRAKDEGELTVSNKAASLAYDYFYTEKWFLNTHMGFEQDEINEVDLRTNTGAGIGYQMYEGDALNLQYILGLSYLREDFENSPSEDGLAYDWSLDYDQKFWDGNLQLFHNHEILVPTEDTENFLFNSKTGARVPLAEILTATAEIDFDWDNKPVPGNREEDVLYSLKLGYEW